MTSGQFLDRLVTQRLVLRPQRAGDAVTFRRLWTERDPRVPARRRIGHDGRPTVADVAAQLVAQAAAAAPLGLLTVTTTGHDEPLGYCGLLPAEDGRTEVAELAYELLRAEQGHGYATEAASAVVAWAREAGYRRLSAGVWDWNAASRRVLAKLGFCEVGFDEPSSPHGRTVRTVLDL